MPSGSYPTDYPTDPGGYEPPPGYPEPAYQPGKRAARGKRAAYPPSEESYPQEPVAEAYEEPYEPPPAPPPPPPGAAAGPPPPGRPPRRGPGRPERPAFFEDDDRRPRTGRYDDRYEAHEYDYDDYDDDYDDRPRRRFGLRGCLAVLVALIVVVGVLVVGGAKGYGWLKDTLAPPADYAGPGSGAVTFQVKEGDNGAVQGRNLKALGVVESVDAYIDAYGKNPDSSGIQVGFYTLKKHMKAADAVKWLADPAHVMKNNVTIVEGSRAKAIYKTLSAKTKIPVPDFKKAAKDPTAIGLPSYAKGNVEGYLFPATYPLPPKVTAPEVLKMMVDRWKQSIGDNDVAAEAKKLGYTPEQVMTVASLVQAEGRGKDMGKIARVIYNRVENPGTAGQTGKLQIDATVNYALGRSGSTELGGVSVTSVNSPYNTYLHKGLPPGPIGSPGDEAIKAALNPTAGDWYYYVTVNLKTGETKFAKTYDEFLKYRAEYKNYCATQSASC